MDLNASVSCLLRSLWGWSLSIPISTIYMIYTQSKNNKRVIIMTIFISRTPVLSMLLSQLSSCHGDNHSSPKSYFHMSGLLGVLNSFHGVLSTPSVLFVSFEPLLSEPSSLSERFLSLLGRMVKPLHMYEKNQQKLTSEM